MKSSDDSDYTAAGSKAEGFLEIGWLPQQHGSSRWIWRSNQVVSGYFSTEEPAMKSLIIALAIVVGFSAPSFAKIKRVAVMDAFHLCHRGAC